MKEEDGRGRRKANAELKEKMLYVNGGNKPHLNEMHVTTEINAK